jgi:hypothetical protein
LKGKREVVVVGNPKHHIARDKLPVEEFQSFITVHLDAELLECHDHFLQVNLAVLVLVKVRELEPQVFFVFPHIVDELRETDVTYKSMTKRSSYEFRLTHTSDF